MITGNLQLLRCGFVAAIGTHTHVERDTELALCWVLWRLDTASLSQQRTDGQRTRQPTNQPPFSHFTFRPREYVGTTTAGQGGVDKNRGVSRGEWRTMDGEGHEDQDGAKGTTTGGSKALAQCPRVFLGGFLFFSIYERGNTDRRTVGRWTGLLTWGSSIGGVCFTFFFSLPSGGKTLHGGIQGSLFSWLDTSRYLTHNLAILCSS